MTIEIDNAVEEAREIVEKCIKCGLCKSLCPAFKVLREEVYSPRGKAIAINESSFGKFIYSCTLCKACEKQCPLNLELCNAFIKAREVVVGQKKEIPENKEMIKNLDKSGNIFGIEEN